uniref:Aminotransferase-like plant mobile domain-containing protein n=1 Tax=Leersia perrieri TaxID=77586 RepID=A0A0D9VVR1_9ORYZ
MATIEEEELLVQESTLPIISDGDPSRPAVRSAHFLLPRAGGLGRVPKPLDAVLASAYRVRRNERILAQLTAFWSADTNTFAFPWGEATVTLEDVAVLAGLPLFGKPVRARMPAADVVALEAVRSALDRTTYRKPSYAGWVKHFLDRPAEAEDAGGLVEHGAFLAMWLSLFVFASPPFDVVRPQVLPVAARLARGQRVALAPAALAAIYGDLTALKRFFRSDQEAFFQVRAPMHVLLLWVWERFPQLRPDMASTPDTGTDARRALLVARWHDAHKAFDDWYVHGVFMSPDKFDWRPYGSRSIALPPRKSKAGSWVRGHCILTCPLHGACANYNPHRVATQFGFDQDVPGMVARSNSHWKEAWGTYTFGCQKFAFIVPHYKLGVTIEYARWWEPYSLACSALVSNYANTKEIPVLFTGSKQNIKELSGANSCKKRKEDPLDEIPLIERLNNIIVVRSSKQGQIADVARESVSKFIGGKEKNMIVQQDAEQYLSDSRRVLDSLADESSCVSVTKAKQRISLPRSKQEARHHALTYVVKTSNSVQVIFHHDIEGAASTGSNEANEAATTADMPPTLEDILVTSDDNIDEEAYVQEDVLGGINLKSPQMETATSTLFGLNEELNLVGAKNNGHDNPILNEATMEYSWGYELDAVLRGAALRQESTDATHFATIQIVTGKEQLAALESTEKDNEGNSESNQAAGSLIKDCVEETMAFLLTFLTEVSSKTLYYLTTFGLSKNTHERDASDTNRDQEVYEPRREVGTREVIEKSFAAREAQKVELETVIKYLKEQVGKGRVAGGKVGSSDRTGCCAAGTVEG